MTSTKKRSTAPAENAPPAAAAAARLTFNLFELGATTVIEHAIAYIDQHAADRPEAVLCAMDRVLGELECTAEYWQESADEDREWANTFYNLARELLHNEALGKSPLMALHHVWTESAEPLSDGTRSNFAGWFAELSHSQVARVCRHRLGIVRADGRSHHDHFIREIWDFVCEADALEAHLTTETSRRAAALDVITHFVAIAVEYAANERAAAVDPSVSVKAVA